MIVFILFSPELKLGYANFSIEFEKLGQDPFLKTKTTRLKNWG